MKQKGKEPKRLSAGKAFHKKIQAEWEGEAQGFVEPEKGIEKLNGRKGRIDIIVDSEESTKALVEIRNSDWDKMAEVAVKRDVRRQIRQIRSYIEAQPYEADGICPGIIFPKRPESPQGLV